MKTYDLIVIGFGKAGKTLAKYAASTGQHVAVIRTIFENVWRHLYQYRMYTFEDTCT